MEQQVLKRTLTPLMLWGLGVGYVISGMYFGWNLGLEKGGTWGLAISLMVLAILVNMVIPKSGVVNEKANDLQNKVEKTAPVKAPVNLPSAPLNGGK